MTGNADVIVVGGGPAGAMTAAILARRGVDVLLLERSKFPREKACGEYFSPGVLDVLARHDVLEPILALEHRRHPGMLLRTSRTNALLHYRDGDIDRSSFSIQRPLFDAALLHYAIGSGVEVRQATRVCGVEVENDRVVGVRVGPGDRTQVLRARIIVAADGLHSTVSRALGLDRPVRWPTRLGLIARYEIPRRILDHAEMHVGSRVYCGLNPVGADLVNVGLVGPLRAKRGGETVAEYFERRAASIPPTRDILANGQRVTPIRGMGPLARSVRRVAGPGYLLVGDAAGFFDPFTGEGVFRAIRGAELAVDAIEAAIRTGASEPVGYEAARRRAFRRKEQLCWLVQGFLTSPSLFDYALGRLDARPFAATVLAGALGDFAPAADAIHPRQLWTLLKP